MKLYRVVVMYERMPGSRWHDGGSFAAVGSTPEAAARVAMEAYKGSALAGRPAPIGAIAVEMQESAIALGDHVSAVEVPEMKKMAKKPGWVAYAPVTAGA